MNLKVLKILIKLLNTANSCRCVNEKFSKSISRRTTLKSLGALATTSGVASVPVRSLTSETIDYPKLISGDTVVEYISVPKDWDQQRRHAKDVLEQVRPEFQRIVGVLGTELTGTSETFGGHPGLEISVVIDPETDALTQLPDEIQGINVSTKEKQGVFTTCSSETRDDNCTNNEKNDYVEGGQNVGWTQQTNGTSCCRVTYNGAEHLLTCGHAFWENCDDATSNDLTNRVAEAGTDGEKIGETAKVDVQGDWSIIDTSHGGNYYDVIDDNNNYPKVVGYVTKDTLDYWASSTDYCAEQMGRSTGHTTGQVENVNANYTFSDCTDMRGEGVRTKANTAEGDSGGPTYMIRNGDAFLICVTCYGYDPYSQVCDFYTLGDIGGGIGAYWLANNADLTFGDNLSI